MFRKKSSRKKEEEKVVPETERKHKKEKSKKKSATSRIKNVGKKVKRTASDVTDSVGSLGRSLTGSEDYSKYGDLYGSDEPTPSFTADTSTPATSWEDSAQFAELERKADSIKELTSQLEATKRDHPESVDQIQALKNQIEANQQYIAKYNETAAFGKQFKAHLETVELPSSASPAHSRAASTVSDSDVPPPADQPPPPRKLSATLSGSGSLGSREASRSTPPSSPPPALPSTASTASLSDEVKQKAERKQSKQVLELQEKIAVMAEEKKQLQEKINNLQSALNNNISEVSRIRDDLNDAEKQKDRFAEDEKQAQQALTKKTAKVSELKSQLTSLQQEQTIKKNQLAAFQKEVKELSAANLALNKEVKELKKKLKESLGQEERLIPLKETETTVVEQLGDGELVEQKPLDDLISEVPEGELRAALREMQVYLNQHQGSTAAVQLEPVTRTLIAELDINNSQNKSEQDLEDDRLAAIKRFEKNSKKITSMSGGEVFGKICLVVLAAAVGFAVGAVIGAGIGFLAGLPFGGPAGGAVGALVGMAKGSVTAGGIAMTAAAGALGVTAAVGSGVGFFAVKSEEHKLTEAVTKKANYTFTN